MKRLMFLIVAVLPTTMVVAGGEGEPAPSAEPARTEVLAEFPIRGGWNPLIVPVTLNGRSYPFIIDTGASHIMYDKSLEGQLGPVVSTRKSSTASGMISTKAYNAPDARLGPLSLRTKEYVVCVDLSFTRVADIPRIYGIIGMTFLRNYVLTLDSTHRSRPDGTCSIKDSERSQTGYERSRQPTNMPTFTRIGEFRSLHPTLRF